MFSFRTTPLEDQMDKALAEGRVGCFCTQGSWDPDKGRYVYEIFRVRQRCFNSHQREKTMGLSCGEVH